MPASPYKTRDIGLSTFLVLSGFPVVSTESDEAGAVWFVHHGPSRREKDAYHRGAKVGAADYYRTLKNLRSLVFWSKGDKGDKS